MSFIKHKYINKTKKYKLPKNKTKNNIKPINKMVKYSNRNITDIISKRYLFISICLIFFFIIITIRLFDLQVNKYEKYNDKLAISTEKTVEGSSAPRGRIYDRNYRLLVDNKAVKTIYYKKEDGVTRKEEIDLAYLIGDIIEADYSKLSEYRLKTFYYHNNIDECKKKIK